MLGLLWWLGGKEETQESMQETQVGSLGREYSLEKEMATHSRVLT